MNPIPAPGAPGAPDAPALVLDTNVVLDWLLFGDPSSAAWAEAISGRRVRWIATAAMRDELEHVLGRGLACRHGADTARLLRAWDAQAQVLPAPPRQALVCRDGDDQKFVDLALAAGARWLLSRDRAVLRLARGAAVSGLLILGPDGWTAAP